MAPTLSQINAVRVYPAYPVYLEPILILYSHIQPGLVILCPGIPTKTYEVSLVTPMRAASPDYSIVYETINVMLL
jgi:hypothetical protein